MLEMRYASDRGGSIRAEDLEALKYFLRLSRPRSAMLATDAMILRGTVLSNP